MTLPANDDVANVELSIEDLDAVAAGWPHWLNVVVDIVIKTSFVGAFVAIAVAGCGGNSACLAGKPMQSVN